MSLAYLVGVGVDFKENGAAARVQKIAQSLETAAKKTDLFTASVAKSTTAVDLFATAVDRGTVSLAGFAATADGAASASAAVAAALRIVAKAGDSAASGARKARKDIQDVGSAAAYSAGAVGALAAQLLNLGAVGSSRALGTSAARVALNASTGTGLGPMAIGVNRGMLTGSAQAALSPAATIPMLDRGPIGGALAVAGATGLSGGSGGPGIPIGPGTSYFPAPGGSNFAFGRGGGAGGGGSVPPGGSGGGGTGGGSGPFFSGTMAPAFAGTMGTQAIHFARHAMTLGAETAIGFAGDSLYESGKLQQELTKIQVGTGANASQMSRVRDLAYDLSDKTAQSVAQSAGVIGVMASSGINNVEDLLRKDKQGHTFAETAAKFADVQYLKSGGQVSFEEGSKQAIQLAHLYRAYKPDEIKPVLDQVTKLSFMMPDSLNRYLTQAGYYVPLLSRLGVPQDQSLVLGGFLDRMGLGKGKGGTAIQNFVTAMMKPLELTGHKQAGQRTALKALGIYNQDGTPNASIFRADKNGHSVVDVFKALEAVNHAVDQQTKGLKGDARAKKERELVGDFQKAFGLQGQRFGLLGDEKGIEQLMGMVRQMGTMPDVNSAQNKFMQNMNSQGVRAFSNFQSLLTEVGSQAIPGVTKAFTDLGDSFHNAQAWLHQHGDIEKKIQKDILHDVTETEKWMVSHHRDFQTMGNDIVYLGKAAQRAGPALAKDGDVLIGMYDIITGPFKFALDQIARYKNYHDQQWAGNYDGDPSRVPVSAFGAPSGGGGGPHYGSSDLFGIGAPPARPGRGPRLTRAPQVHASVDLHLKNGSELGNAVANAAGPTIARMVAMHLTGSRDMRSVSGRTGTQHTSSHQPTTYNQQHR